VTGGFFMSWSAGESPWLFLVIMTLVFSLAIGTKNN
jgi:hypothetical protein